MNIFRIIRGTSYPNPSRNEDCAEPEVDKFIISQFVLETLIPAIGFHPFPLDELMLMTATVVALKPSHIFEWGTHMGKSARAFHEISKAFGIITEIHSTDLPENEYHLENIRKRRGAYVRRISSVHLHLGDGLETSLGIYAQFKTKIHPALFFLDGDHSYGSLRRELAAIRAAVPAAALMVHDTFYQSPESGYNTGPHQAVEELIRSHPEEYLRLSTSLGLPGMTLLYPRTGLDR